MWRGHTEDPVASSGLIRRPRSVAEAVAAIAECPDFTVCAGGTALMAQMNRDPATTPVGWIFLRNIEELRGYERTENGAWRLGSLLTLDRLSSLGGAIPPLAKAAGLAGSWQLRNAATVGGNLVAAGVTSDLIPPLQCLDGEVEIASQAGIRRAKMEEFLLGPARTGLAPGEIVTAVVVKAPTGTQSYERVGVRAAMSTMICAVAVQGGASTAEARVVVADGGHLARRVPDAERLLWTAGSLDQFVAAAQAATAPIDDELASASYRRHAIGVLARRAFVGATGGGQ
jgi:CO/xanthine dehydrogenase FAD-binding subunit